MIYLYDFPSFPDRWDDGRISMGLWWDDDEVLAEALRAAAAAAIESSASQSQTEPCGPLNSTHSQRAMHTPPSGKPRRFYGAHMCSVWHDRLQQSGGFSCLLEPLVLVLCGKRGRGDLRF